MNTINRILSRIVYYFMKNYALYIKKDLHTIQVHRWYKDNGDSSLRTDYPLSDSCVVFDLGGYKGDWSKQIAKRYNCYIYIFEPVNEFYEQIRELFKHNPKISVLNFGLSGETKKTLLYLNNDGSSVFQSGTSSVEITLIDIVKFMDEKGIRNIDLIKINIEGGEFELLKRMIEAKLLNLCKDIQIQFHSFYPNAVNLRDEIRNELHKTHFLTYDYPFVWENWRKKNNV